MNEEEIPLIEVPEPSVRFRYLEKCNPLILRHPEEVIHEKRDQDTISRFTSEAGVIVVSFTGMLEYVGRFCQSTNHALFHLWDEALAIHSTEVFSYDNERIPINVAEFMRGIFDSGFALRESFARHAAKKMLNACCFSFQKDTEKETSGIEKDLFDIFRAHSFTRVNITRSLHEVKKSKLFKVDVIDLDGHVSAQEGDFNLDFLNQKYSLFFHSPVLS